MTGKGYKKFGIRAYAWASMLIVIWIVWIIYDHETNVAPVDDYGLTYPLIGAMVWALAMFFLCPLYFFCIWPHHVMTRNRFLLLMLPMMIAIGGAVVLLW